MDRLPDRAVSALWQDKRRLSVAFCVSGALRVSVDGASGGAGSGHFLLFDFYKLRKADVPVYDDRMADPKDGFPARVYRCAPQTVIIPISVTLRYFPAIREESGYIRDAMKLKNLHGGEKVEAFVVPLMMSAVNTAEELAAAAVTRGIENPVKKTSTVQLHIGVMDCICILVAAGFLVAALAV